MNSFLKSVRLKSGAAMWSLVAGSGDRGAGSAAALIWPHGALPSSGGIQQFESS